jgi:ubiquinone biosynthesis protein UbiJ
MCRAAFWAAANETAANRLTVDGDQPAGADLSQMLPPGEKTPLEDLGRGLGEDAADAIRWRTTYPLPGASASPTLT